MNKKAVIFDLDGTLLDTLDDLANAVNYILKKYDFPQITKADVRRFLGNGAKNLIKRSLPASVEDEMLERILADYKEYYNAHSKIETKPYPGVLELLTELKRNGVKTAVVSNKPDTTVKLLAKEYFGDLLDFALGDKAGINMKPAADPILFAMKELGCDRAVYVGDSEVDVLAAQNAKLPCVSMTWGFRDREELENACANVFADDASQLRMHIYGLLSEEDC